MLRYIRHSDIAIRLNLNPFNWEWKPFFTRDAPTPFFPNRTTYAIGWLCIQIFVDTDNGTRDFKSFNSAFIDAMDLQIEMHDNVFTNSAEDGQYEEMGLEDAPSVARDSIVEQRPKHADRSRHY